MKKLRRIQDLVSQKERRSATLEEALEKMADGYLEKHDPIRKAPVTGQVSGKRIPIHAAIKHQVEHGGSNTVENTTQNITSEDSGTSWSNSPQSTGRGRFHRYRAAKMCDKLAT